MLLNTGLGSASPSAEWDAVCEVLQQWARQGPACWKRGPEDMASPAAVLLEQSRSTTEATASPDQATTNGTACRMYTLSIYPSIYVQHAHCDALYVTLFENDPVLVYLLLYSTSRQHRWYISRCWCMSIGACRCPVDLVDLVSCAITHACMTVMDDWEALCASAFHRRNLARLAGQPHMRSLLAGSSREQTLPTPLPDLSMHSMDLSMHSVDPTHLQAVSTVRWFLLAFLYPYFVYILLRMSAYTAVCVNVYEVFACLDPFDGGCKATRGQDASRAAPTPNWHGVDHMNNKVNGIVTAGSGRAAGNASRRHAQQAHACGRRGAFCAGQCAAAHVGKH